MKSTNIGLGGILSGIILLILSFVFLNITAYPQIGDGLIVTETDGGTLVSEDGLTDTVTLTHTELSEGEYRNYAIEFGDNYTDLDSDEGYWTFDHTNWDTPVTVEIEAYDDSNVEGTETLTIGFELVGSDLESRDIDIQFVFSNPVDVTIEDNDGVEFSTDIFGQNLITDSIEIDEGESFDVYVGLSEPIFPNEGGDEGGIIDSSLSEYVSAMNEGGTPQVGISFVAPEGVAVSPSAMIFEGEGGIEIIPESVSTQNEPEVQFDTQLLTITVEDDELYTGDYSDIIEVNIDGVGTNYQALTEDQLPFNVIEDDARCKIGGNGTEQGVDCGGIDYPNNGDANNDGELDANQENVKVARDDSTGHVTVLKASGGNVENFNVRQEFGPVQTSRTLAVNDVISFTIDAATSDIELLYYVDEVTDEDGTVTDIKELDKSTPQIKAVKIDETSGEVTEIDDAVVSVVTIDGDEAIKVEYTVTDGGPLDADGEVNGSIVDPTGIVVDTNDTDDSLIRTGGSEQNYTFTLVIMALLASGMIYFYNK